MVGPAAAFFIWLTLSLAALVVAWWLGAPGTGPTRYLWLLGTIGWYPVLYSLSLGQPAMLVLLVVIACWRLAESGRPYLAGAILGLSVLKPQLIIAVPFVLLLSGRWRVTAGWASVVNNRFFTWAYVVGPGPASYAIQTVVIALGLVAAYVNRHASLARLIALGLLISCVSATYWHLQDFAILVGAAWLFIRDEPPWWQKTWLVVVALTAELAWPLGPLPVLIAVAVWLAMLAIPRRTATDRPRLAAA